MSKRPHDSSLYTPEVTSLQLASALHFTYGKQRTQTMKMLYYLQGYHLALTNTPLFVERIKRWDMGPVVSSTWGTWEKEGLPPASQLPSHIALLVETVCELHPGDGKQLIQATHEEPPWKDTERDAEISQDKLRQYFERNAPLTDEVAARYFGKLMNSSEAVIAEDRRSAKECGMSLLEFLRHGYESWCFAEQWGIISVDSVRTSCTSAHVCPQGAPS